MKIVKTLNKIEIEYIIAQYFNTDVTEVKLIPFTETVGYGLMEHEKTNVKCEVIMTEEIKKE